MDFHVTLLHVWSARGITLGQTASELAGNGDYNATGTALIIHDHNTVSPDQTRLNRPGTVQEP